MIRWILEIDSHNFPIFFSRLHRERSVILRASVPVEPTFLVPDTTSPQNGEDIPERDGPEYERERPPQERDYMSDDYEQGLYEYRDQYDWRYEGRGWGQSWSYSDETLPMDERSM